MTTETSFPQAIDFTHTGMMEVEGAAGGWTIVRLPGISDVLGTRKAVKVAGTIDDHEFAATLMSLGNGLLMVPIKAALRKKLKKEAGSEVTIHLTQRFT